MDAAFTSLYDEARSALVEGYRKADQSVLSFAIEHDTSTYEVWRLIGDEASLQGDRAMEYLAEHPLEARPSTLSVEAVAKALGWAWEKWSTRGRGQG